MDLVKPLLQNRSIRPLVRSGGGSAPAGPSNTHSLQLVRASGQCVSITHAAQTGLAFSNATTATFAWWAYFETLPGTSAHYVAIHKGGSTSGRYRVRVGESGGGYIVRLLTSGNDGGANENFAYDIPVSLSAQTWVHLAVVFDTSAPSGQQVELFADGSSVGHGTALTEAASEIDDDGQTFYVGRDTGGDYWDGRLDDIFVGDQALSAAQIATLMNNGPAVSTPGIKDAWKWDGESYVSVTGNNELTPQNSPTFSTDTPY